MITLRALPLLLLAGCVLGSERYPRPRDLPSSSLVDRTRVLAIRADPPEVAPGGTVTFEALLPDPDGTVAQVLWVACPPEQTTSYGCMIDLSALGDDATPEDLAEAGIIGFEPGLAPRYEAGPELLEGLDERTRREGVNVTVQLFALPPGEPDAEIDFNQVESAFKRLVVSDDTAPNQNPELTGFRLDALDVSPDAPLEVDPDQLYDVDVVLADGAIEDYVYIDGEGAIEDRTEEPYVTWYTTGGEIGNPYGLHPYTAVPWRSPSTSGEEGTLYAVVRDRRGGMAWWEQPFRVR